MQKQPLHAGKEVRRGNELLHHALPLLEKVLGLQLVPEVVVINLRYEDEFLARVVDRERVVCLSPMIQAREVISCVVRNKLTLHCIIRINKVDTLTKGTSLPCAIPTIRLIHVTWV